MGGAVIPKEDVVESFVRSSGPGGQNVNKVSTCVVLLHKPTGTIVKCRQFRTQFLNRQQAWVMLYAALEQKQKEHELYCRALREKKRRQNRKRSRTAKERVLENKKRNASKKQGRKKVSEWE